MKVVLSLDLLVAPGQGCEIGILALQVRQNGPIGRIHLREELLHQGLVVSRQGELRLPQRGFPALLADLRSQPLEVLARARRRREHPDGVLQQDGPQALELAPGGDARRGRLARNLVVQQDPGLHGSALYPSVRPAGRPPGPGAPPPTRSAARAPSWPATEPRPSSQTAKPARRP